MTIGVPPPYPGEKGKIGERVYNWLLKIPVIGNIFTSTAEREKWLHATIKSADVDTLYWYSTYGDARLKEAASIEMKDRYPYVAAEQTRVGRALKEFQQDPSSFLADKMRGIFDTPFMRELSETVGSLVFDSVMTMAIGGKEKLPKNLQERIRRFLGTTVLLTAAPKVAGITTETATGGLIKTVGGIMSDAYFNLGLGFVTWQMTSPLIDGGIGQDLKHMSNLIFRPKRFTWSQIRDLYSMGHLSYNDLHHELQRLGWRDQDIGKIVSLAYKDLSDSTVLGMWTQGILDEDDVLNRLRGSGYRYEDAALIMDYTRSTRINPQKDVLLSTARKAFKNQLIAEDRFRGVLAELGYTEEAIGLEIAVSRLTAEEDERNLSVSQLKAAFLNNVITEVEALGGLQGLAFRNDEAGVLIETWKRSRAPKVLRVNKQTILQAWVKGVLTETETRSKISEVGYSPGDVDLIIETARAGGAILRPQASVGLLIEGVRTNVITVSDLRTELRARRYVEFDVELITGVAEMKRVLDLTPDNILDAFQSEVITRDVAQQKLIDLGLTIASASLLLETREAVGVVERPVIPLGMLMAMTSEGLITIPHFAELLVERGFSDEDVDRLVVAVRYERPAELSRSLIERAYNVGVLTRPEALDRLIDLGFTIPDANTILTTVEEEREIIPPRVTVGMLVEGVRTKLISVDTLRTDLTERGYSPADINLIVGITQLQPVIGLTPGNVLDAFQADVITREIAERKLLDLGVELTTARMRLDTVEAKVRPLVPITPLGVLMALASEALISIPEFQTILRERNFPNDDIERLVMAVRYDPPTELSRSLVERAYKVGVVTRDEAIDRLIILKFTPSDANTILLTVEEEMELKQPQASVSNYVTACRDGIITPAELEVKLGRRGMNPEDVRLFVSLATYSAAESEKKLSKTDVLNAYKEGFFGRVDALIRLEMLGYGLEDAEVLLRLKKPGLKDSEVHTLYKAGILTMEQAAIAFSALGFSDEQIIDYFMEHG